MDEEAFLQLGIEPTTDETAIRRAYAARLKVVQGDLDRDAFMTLRQAYEDAMEIARATLSEDVAGDDDPWDFDDVLFPDDPEHDESDEHPASEPVTVDVDQPIGEVDTVTTGDQITPIEFGARAEFQREFSAALEDKDSRAAARILQAALARGLVPIGDESRLAAALMDAAVMDPNASVDELEQLAEAFGREQGAQRPGVLTDNMHRLQLRIGAARWLEKLEAEARKGGFWLGRLLVRRFRRGPRMAAAILGHSTIGLRGWDLETLRKETALAVGYAPWLDGRVDVAKLSKKVTTFARRIELSFSKAMLIALLLGSSGWLANKPDYDLASLAVFSLALILIGNWFFTLVGLLILSMVAFALSTLFTG